MIEIRNLRAGYDGNDVIKDLNLKIDSGENLCILGPNGCGKTTLLRIIAGVLGFRGEVLLDGVDIRRIKRKVLSQRVGLLSQNTSVYFNYSVLETVMMGRYAHSGGEASARDASVSAIERVGLTAQMHKDIDTLSGGQLQRVFLAKLIAQDPEVILLDEPTNHLDLGYQVELIRFLHEWSACENKTIIGVLHDINHAVRLADRIVLMSGGEIKAAGDTKEIVASAVLSEVFGMDINGYMKESLSLWI